MEVKKNNDALTIIHNYKSGDNYSYLLLSDIHFDSIKCDRNLLKEHLDEAKRKDAKILIFGDFFDAMGGKWDKRSSKSDIRPEYNTQTYFQDICRDAAKFMKPYSDNLILLVDGNHETSIKSHHEFDLLDDLRERLNPDFETNEKIFRGKYSGFVRFKFTRNGSANMSKLLYYTHGSGGNSPVTVGTIKTNRRQVSVLADLYVSGHIHTEFEVPRTQAYLNSNDKVKVKKCYHWQLGTYKNDYMSGGWADHKEFSPPNLGGRFIELMPIDKKINNKSELYVKVKSYLT